MANIIGKVALLQGHAYAKGPDGRERALKVGDVVYEGDVIVTAANSRVELAFEGGQHYLVRGNETVTLDKAVLGDELPEARDAALIGRVAESAEIARVIAEGGSLDELFEETAAGFNGGAANDGHGFVEIGRIREGVSGASYQYDTARERVQVGLPEGGRPDAKPTVPPTISVSAPDDTNDATPLITGSSNAPDGSLVTVTISQDGRTYVLTTTTIGGAFSIDAPPMADGPYTVTARITDAFGNSAFASDDGSLDTVAAVPTISLNPNVTADHIVNAAETGGTVTITGVVGGEAPAAASATLTGMGRVSPGLG